MNQNEQENTSFVSDKSFALETPSALITDNKISDASADSYIYKQPSLSENIEDAGETTPKFLPIVAELMQRTSSPPIPQSGDSASSSSVMRNNCLPSIVTTRPDDIKETSASILESTSLNPSIKQTIIPHLIHHRVGQNSLYTRQTHISTEDYSSLNEDTRRTTNSQISNLILYEQDGTNRTTMAQLLASGPYRDGRKKTVEEKRAAFSSAKPEMIDVDYGDEMEGDKTGNGCAISDEELGQKKAGKEKKVRTK